MASKKKIETLYEDEFLVAVNKPAGLLSIPDRFKPDLPNIQSILRSRFGEIFTVHRLDKGTSGVMLFAKDAETHRQLSKAFENREVKKLYRCVAKGTPSSTSGEISEKIGRSPKQGGKMVLNRSGKESITFYEVLESYPPYHEVQVQILTGRTHQIRIHLPSVGLHILGDSLYGRGDFFVSELKGKKFRLSKGQEEKPLLVRPCLHALSLSFKHPHKKSEIEISAPFPKDYKATLNQIKKWKA
ncbi:MAG: RluA family pseudouridine synthase [Saprospiraceae bacterium]|nr:RluA family pseudouridine synthase [Saprospiraceae bacterium]